MLPTASEGFYAGQQRRAVATVGLVRREWAGMGVDFDGSWRVVGPRVLLLTSAAQVGAAAAGASYVPAALAEQGVRPPPTGEVVPARFAGVASDGRPLESLLFGAVTSAKEAVDDGASPSQALALGGRALDMYVHTMVADAGRGGSSVAIAARPTVGWRRMVNPPCCKRCAVLAGKWFRWNQGFRRHPRCDCVHVPAVEDSPGDVGTDPDLLFASGQVKGLTSGEASAIRDGADPARVVNARRGMTTTGASGGVTPDAIYRASSTREDAVARLRAAGYLN